MKAMTELDKEMIRRSFAAASAGYDGMAELQRQVARELLARSDLSGRHGCVLDVGSGTGYFTRLALARCECERMLAMDIALPMLTNARGLNAAARIGYICGDAERLPLAANSVDRIVSNLALQWCQDLPSVFFDFRRILTAGGKLAFSTFGPATLNELKVAWSQVDEHTHVNAFYDLPMIEAFLAQAGFRLIDAESSLRHSYYPCVLELMRELKGIGAHNVTAGRNRSMTTRSQLQKMIDAYPAESDGRIRSSYEILYFTALKE